MKSRAKETAQAIPAATIALPLSRPKPWPGIGAVE